MKISIENTFEPYRETSAEKLPVGTLVTTPDGTVGLRHYDEVVSLEDPMACWALGCKVVALPVGTTLTIVLEQE